MNKGVHRFALLVAGATFFLIIAGALVTSHDAGLATADWPLTEGRFLPKVESLGINTGVNMVGNLFWEHGHRMVATTVGLLTIGLVVFLVLKEKRSWVRRLGWLALLGVVAQGLLGGLTVKLMLPLVVSSAHATLAQLFFCTTVSLAVFTSASWMKSRPLIEEQGSLPVRYVCVAAAATIFLQLVIGGVLLGGLIVFWSVFMAPKAPMKLKPQMYYPAKIIIYGLASITIFNAEPLSTSILFILLAVTSEVALFKHNIS